MNILFLCLDMDGLHGSFLHVMEYAEFYKSIGCEITIASVYIAESNRKMAEARCYKAYSVGDVPNIEYDIVYALHLLLFPALVLKGLRYVKAISMSLSPFLPIEMIAPLSFLPQFDLVSVISQEAADHISRKFGINKDLLKITPNHIPLAFLDKSHEKKVWNPEPKKIAVVSNHFIEELEAIKDGAPFQVDYIGKDYDNVKEITPDLLLEYDVIVTIGKTVQYGLGLGIPVFEYDQYGGCGYISPDNLPQEEAFNFSGRKTKRKLDAGQIQQELLSGYKMACENAPVLRELAIRRYSIRNLVEKQLAEINAHNMRRPKLSSDALLFANAAYAALGYMLNRKVD